MGDGSSDALAILENELKRIRSSLLSALDADAWEHARGLTYAAEALSRAIDAVRKVPLAQSPAAASQRSSVLPETTSPVAIVTPVESKADGTGFQKEECDVCLTVDPPNSVHDKSTEPTIATEKEETLSSPSAKASKSNAARKRISRYRDEIRTLNGALPTGKDWCSSDWCLWRKAICKTRAAVEATKDSVDAKKEFEAELQNLSERATELAIDSKFFGFNMKQSVSEEGWNDLAEGFEWLSEAYSAKDWLDVTPQLDPSHRKQLVLMVGQSAQYLLDLQSRLSISANDWVTTDLLKWYKGQNKGQSAIAKPQKNELRELEKKWRKFKSDHERKEAQQAAMQALRKHVEHSVLEGKEELEGEESEARKQWNLRLCELVDHCLECGVPPSNKELVSMLIEFLSTVNSICVHKEAKKIAKYVQDQVRKDQGKFIEGLDEAVFNNVDAQLLAEMLPNLKNKQLLLIGGNKGQRERRLKLQELFQCTIEWPDMEEDTNMNLVRPLLPKADIVGYLIRFSRHHYKELMDAAKDFGKDVVFFPAGLSPNRLMFDMKRQLFGGRV
jgi:hypothetical protein